MSFKLVLNKIKSNFWIVPAIYGVCFFLLAILSTMLDRSLAQHPNVMKFIPSVFLIDKELSRSVLSAIATSLLTMTTITFSSILVVLTTFLAQFSPRTLQNFNTDSKTQQVLGTFIGGYIYVIVLLIQVRDNGLSNKFIVPSFAVLVAFICIGMFVFLIHHVIDWIKVGNLISNITKETLSSIKENKRDEKKLVVSKEDANLNFQERKSIEIKSKKQGYIQFVEIVGMVDYAHKSNIIIKFEKVPGDYVDVDTPLLTVWDSQDSSDNNIFDYIFITPDQESIQDVEFGIQKLVEIALRAIAPGKNDPETAINCIEHLAQVLTKYGKSPAYPYYYDKQNNVRVILEKPSFTDYLYESFYQIRHYGKADVSVMTSIIKALALIAETNDNEIKNLTWDFSDYIIEGIKREEWLRMDKLFLNNHLKKLAKACNKNFQDHLLPIE